MPPSSVRPSDEALLMHHQFIIIIVVVETISSGIRICFGSFSLMESFEGVRD